MENALNGKILSDQSKNASSSSVSKTRSPTNPKALLKEASFLDQENVQMYRGYIKFWRKAKDWAFYQQPHALALWVTLLCEANHKPIRKFFSGKVIIIEAGQFITGRKYLSELTGVSESTVEKYLNLFHSENQIIQQKTNVNRLISIVNWKQYQGSEFCGTQPSKQRTIQRPTQPRDTPKNGNNDKNVKNIFKKPSVIEIQIYAQERQFALDAEHFFDYYEANGWMRGKSKIKDWKAVVRTWQKNNNNKIKGETKHEGLRDFARQHGLS